jgi:rsbT co-antagonist protein RsbR
LDGDHASMGTLDDELPKTVAIHPARLERIVTAVALATTGLFDGAATTLAPTIEDELGLVEEALRMFFDELRAAETKTSAAISALTSSKKELEEKIGTIETQRREIDELSAPIIDVWSGVLTLPLMGLLDVERAALITEALLRRVTDTRARWVLVDLTGVRTIDAATAEHLGRLVQAVALIGARCIVTGIGPHLVGPLLAFDGLQRFRPMRTLQEGLQYCMARMRPEGRSAAR